MAEQVDLNSPNLPDQELVLDETKDESVETPCNFVTGIAGSGKTFSVRQKIEEDPKWGLICATTGIAAVNLGTVTMHSALGLHPDSIEDQFTSGYMRARMHQVARQYRNLVIDECSMLSGRLLDMLYQTAQQVNEFKDVQGAFGLTLVGDFCQLPPINEPWCFESECWPHFEQGTTKLTKNWRQGDGPFLDALNLLRSGNGAGATSALARAGVGSARALDPSFDGTVILGRNAEVDNYNTLRYWKLKGEEHSYPSYRWGKESGGWKNIPPVLKLKEGALVMILANDTARDEMGQPMFRWVNGDCGHVRGFQGGRVQVELLRTGQVVSIETIERRTQQKQEPDEFTEDEVEAARKGAPHVRLPDRSFYERGFWVRGAVEYVPLRLAYATTVHKSQGLTLDRVQVDMRHAFVGEPAMLYVAASRCRTAQGLTLVGPREMVVRRCRVDAKVVKWL